LPKLPKLTIIVTGKNQKDFDKTVKNIEAQGYRNIDIVKNRESLPKFFNSITKDSDYYGFIFAGDRLEKNAINLIMSKFASSEYIGAVYSDLKVQNEDIPYQFYMPPHDQTTFGQILGIFPFFISKSVSAIEMDENLENLYGHNLLLRASTKYIINHIPKALFRLKYKEVDLESDMKYINKQSEK